ncbi:Ig-like domain repeat protein [Nocardioides sp. KIGAM211]|uniref:alpha-amylase n=1 Tax=Nocardioides luti TaxID=2761101 RepID=A0A7X0RFV6_9ACTN|nr:Ig-like domain repeat protein [Nocardioides luti]MBB6627452.1 Ig-like domain repeat protein [Nocardioides luti]
MVVKRIAVVAVLGALGLVPVVSPSQAVGHAGAGTGTVVARATVDPPLIQGLAIDQTGHYVDGVTVQATRADGTPAASDLTYASKWDDGPQHGYFYLEVGRRGTYTLTLSKSGYVTATFGPVHVRKNQRLGLGEILVKKVLPASSTTAGLDDKSLSVGQKGKVRVKVTSKATKKPVGEIEVREGKTVVGSGVLRPSDKGQVTVGLKKLGKGTHTLKAYFFASPTLKASTSQPMTLTVKKPKHRPTAW